MSSVSAEELQTLNAVYSLAKSRAFILGVPEHIVTKYFKGARDVLKRIESFEVRNGYVYARILSTEAVRRGKPRSVRVKTLTGEEITVSLGVPLDSAYHYVVVSENIMKCTCQAALRTAAKADKWLEEYLRRHGIQTDLQTLLFAKHVLCKHTAAVLSKAIASGAVQVTEILLDNLTLGIAAAAISEGLVTQQIIDEVLRTIKKR